MSTPEVSPVELLAAMSAAVHTAVRWVALIGSVQGAGAVRDAMDALIPAAQELRGRADAVLTCDEQVEETAVYDDIMDRLHGQGGAL